MELMRTYVPIFMRWATRCAGELWRSTIDMLADALVRRAVRLMGEV